MLNFDEIRDIIIRTKCEPYEFRLACIQCVRHGLGDAPCDDQNHSWFLQARLFRQDTDSGEMGWGAGRKYLLSPHMVRSEIIKTALLAALGYAEHEVREAFKYDGDRLFGPHIDVGWLAAVSENTEARPKTTNA